MHKVLRVTLFAMVFLSIDLKAAGPAVFNGSTILNNANFSSLIVNGSLNFDNLDIRDTAVFNGKVVGFNLRSGHLEINGTATLKKVRVNGISIAGSLAMEDMQVQQTLRVSGSMEGVDIQTDGPSYFSGRVYMDKGRLQDVHVKTDQAFFKDTVMENIYVKSNHRQRTFLYKFMGKMLPWFFKGKPPIINLQGETIVKGNIVFDQEGEVYLKHGSKIDGKVINGKIISK